MTASTRSVAAEILRRKARARSAAAALPIEEKLRRLVAMQRRANEIRRATGRPVMRVWELRSTNPGGWDGLSFDVIGNAAESAGQE